MPVIKLSICSSVYQLLVGRAEPVLRHALLYCGRHSVDLTRPRPRRPGLVTWSMTVLGQGHTGVEGVPPTWKLPRVRQDEVAWQMQLERYLSMSKPSVKVTVMVSEHHRQGQGEHRDHGLAPAAAQVGPGHGERATPFAASLCLASCFGCPPVYRTASMGETFAASRPGLRAGEQHGDQGKQGRAHKDQGAARTRYSLRRPAAGSPCGVSRPPTIQPSTSPMGMPDTGTEAAPAAAA